MSQTLAHGFAQTDTVKHCPFCGSGDVWGGSDGTITCEFDGATFQVSVEPQYPSAPGNIAGQPLDIDGQPNPMGQADAGDAMAVPEGMSPSSGEALGMEGEDGQDEGPAQDEGSGGGPPWASGDEDEDEDEDEEDEGMPPPLPPRRSFRTFAGDTLTEDLYLKHLAIRHAEEPMRFLASLRAGARSPKLEPEPEPWSYENPDCPDARPHLENAADRLGYDLFDGDYRHEGEVSDEAWPEYKNCPGHY